MTIRIELTLDMDSYNKKYGPGSAFAEKYGPQTWQANRSWLEEAIQDVLQEGFHDWYREGWMKLQMQRAEATGHADEACPTL